MENHRTWGEAYDEAIREWKRGNPDWQTYLENPPSPNDPARSRQRRQEIYEAIADWPLAALQRQLNARGLPHNPSRAHWEEFAISEWQTMSQHARGQYLPFHHQMEHFLAHIFETLDSHFGYRGADGLARIKRHVETWFDGNVRKPAEHAFAAVRERQGSQNQSRRAW